MGWICRPDPDTKQTNTDPQQSTLDLTMSDPDLQPVYLLVSEIIKLKLGRLGLAIDF
jgi:hypothetical protein